MISKHAAARAQQRGIPPGIDYYLDLYGRQQHDGHGAIVIYFDKQSRREMERDFGPRFIAKNSEWLDAYKVVSIGGTTITTGHRTGKIWRH